MVKKGKAPATGSSKPPPAKPAASKAKASSSKTASKKPAPPEDDLLIFTTDKERKKKEPAAVPEGPPEPPKPTVKQIIGGQSWTGKLPVNLLSEHCQKMKWQRPDYVQRNSKDGISYMVVISTKDPKTQEIKKLEPFKLPPGLVEMAYKETALEAKHFAATYGLFRVASGKNLSMILPPDYRSVWKDFDNIKKQDIKEGKAWMYDANPFKVLEEREAAKAAAERKRKEQEAAREKAANLPGAAGLVLRGNAAAAGGGFNPMKGWTNIPKIEMGNKTRQHLESLLRRDTIWNPHGVVMEPAARASITKEFTGLGFRASHIEEAVEECKDREETLEWLLIHVPEDDLPKWALPGSYSAGVSVAATNLRREGATERLALSGYSIELCRKVYDESDADEGKAAETLQRILLTSGSDTEFDAPNADSLLSDNDRDQQWEEELASLEALYGEQYSRVGPDVCELKLVDVTNGATKNVKASVQFRKSPHYPSQLILLVIADLPSYIKLSVIKKALAYILESLQGEEMKMFYVISWVQEHINDIIERPGTLREIAAVSSTVAEEKGLTFKKKSRRAPRQPKPISWEPESASIGQWMQRQKAPSFQKMVGQRKKLPAWQVKEDIVDIVNDNQITIISGETGSGKSTQSVQFILDDLYDRGYAKCANIIVTQPRRISALGLADRVSEERATRVGQEVGYSIRGESKTSSETRITFVTTGVLLRRLQTSGGKIEDVVTSLADVSHVVIDEVHERSLDTDFLLSIIRDVLSKRKDLKLILMSATLDSASFGDYFQKDGLKVGFVEIAGRTFPVQDYYLDDIIHQTGFIGNNYDGKASDRTLDDSQRVSKVIQTLGMRINYNLLAETAQAIDSELSQTQKSGGILIFLPGVNEINQTLRYLSSVSNLYVLPLHASLETREQKKVFAPPPHGMRKVVVATNVAETSITIDDIVAVIDSGRVKETSFDPQTNMRRLEETWASRAACKQRRGRAGRVQEGKCYKLYTRNLEEQTMAERPEPEIRRVPLEQLCLSVRAMGNKDVVHFLSRTPTPPEAVAVEGAINMLRRMGALDGDELTALGQQLAMIPADLRCGKLMVYGAIFNCLDDCVNIASILSSRSPFLSPPDKRDLAKQAKMKFAAGDGDLLTDLRAFQQWDEQMQDRAPQRQVRNFCDENFLSYNTLSDIASTRTQYYSALAEIGLVESSQLYGRSQQKTVASFSMPLLRALTASAFSPQIARIQFPDKKFMASVSGAVELDPEAKMIRYYNQENGRVFVHPSSTLFDSQGFSGNAAFVSYFTLMATSKIFVRDLTRKSYTTVHSSILGIVPLLTSLITAFNAYTLLLFSGAIELDTLGRGLVVDGWLKLRGWARIGVLVSRLRGMVDDIIAKKVENPAMDLRDNDVIRAVVKLIELDGLDA